MPRKWRAFAAGWREMFVVAPAGGCFDLELDLGPQMSGNVRRKGDDALLVALASGATIKQAANTAGVAEKTAHRRLADPAFRARLTALRTELLDAAAGRLAAAGTGAVDALQALLTAESEAVRLGAARSLLDLCFKSVDILTWDSRVAEIERKVANAMQDEN